MATLYADASGALVRLAVSDADIAQGAPASAVSTLDFDPATNAALLADLAQAYRRYTLLSGVLAKNGTAVTVAAAGAAYTQRQQVYQQAQQVVDDITAFLALSSPTNAQTLALVKELAQVIRYLIRREVQAQ